MNDLDQPGVDRSASRLWTPPGRPNPRRLVRRLGLALASLAFTTLAFELGARILLEPSDMSAGRLFGVELPPFKLLPPQPIDRSDPGDWYQNLIVDDARITVGDLFGFLREDPLLNYAPEESRRSANGWWQSNHLGARRRQEITPAPGPGMSRILVFGDSFAHGSRVPQRDTFTAVMESLDERLEVVNFGVDGYSLAQSYLRFSQVAEQIDYDVALLVLVPAIDLIRDANTLRSLIGWDSYTVMPRFEMEGDQLRLVQSPYDFGSEIYEDGATSTHAVLQQHLLEHDRFFQPSMYEPTRWLGGSITLKLMQSARYQLADSSRRRSILTPGSEATRVSKAISQAMHLHVEANGGRFAMVLLPTARAVEGSAQSEPDPRWRGWESFFCDGSVVCFDLGEPLHRLDKGVSDRGFDGSHFGPRTNRLIAEALLLHLQKARFPPYSQDTR